MTTFTTHYKQKHQYESFISSDHSSGILRRDVHGVLDLLPRSGQRRILQRRAESAVVDRGDSDDRSADVRSDLRLRAGDGRRGRHGDGLHADGAWILRRLHRHSVCPHSHIL